MEEKVTLVDELKEIKENNKLVKFLINLPYQKYIVTIVCFVVLYFFYQLGYAFLCGIYNRGRCFTINI